RDWVGGGQRDSGQDQEREDGQPDDRGRTRVKLQGAAVVVLMIVGPCLHRRPEGVPIPESKRDYLMRHRRSQPPSVSRATFPQRRCTRMRVVRRHPTTAGTPSDRWIKAIR